jgi:tRNA modification GTPase
VKKETHNHTIVALSTPQGEAGIAVIRLSGPDSLSIVSGVFQGKENIDNMKSHHAAHGWIVEGSEPQDEVIVTLFRSPNSYTGEDVVEVSCHGGPYVSQRIVELFLTQGAKPALPGEFSQRAVLNGKMDLAQAEAVADMIQAKTEASRRVAAYQLEGGLSKRIRAMQEQLLKACSLIELELDFTEEDVEFASRKEMKAMFTEMISDMDTLLASFNRGRVCREGIRMAIVGRPNVGKSSILNSLLERERAIVTEIPGTTRDTIEDVLDIEGILFVVTDTAGLRETEDRIEQEGVRRAEEALDRAELVLLVLDGSAPLQQEDEKLMRRIQDMKRPTLVVVNKADLKQKLNSEKVNGWFSGKNVLHVSALKQNGIRELIDMLKDSVLSEGFPHKGDVVITRIRHRDCLLRAVESLRKAETSLSQLMSQEFIALDLREGLNALGEIIGETTTEDVLNRVFSEFCIGK